MTVAGALLVTGAEVLTMDRTRPRAEAILCADGRILAVGTEAAVREQARVLGGAVHEIQAPGRTIVPAFIDAHIHLLATVSRNLSVDCGPAAVASIADIRARIAEQAAQTPTGEWIRAAGYDESALAERRHPSRHDLDRAAPQHPVRLLHRTGHACVLNSAAMRLAGIGNETPEPPGGYMERDLETGAPTGLLIEMSDLVERAVPPIPYPELARGIAELSASLLEQGTTYVEDATATNDASSWRLLDRLISDRHLRVGVSMLAGVSGESIPEAPDHGGLRLGGIKLQPRELDHEMSPAPDELTAVIGKLQAWGRQIAVHAVGRVAVDACIAAYAAIGAGKVATARHRIEHAGICSEVTAALAGRLGVVVVTQPGFLYWNGDLMRRRLSERDLPDLYPLRRLLDAGVVVAGSSDSPVAGIDPMRAMRAAVERRTRGGAFLNPEQCISPAEALAMYTTGAAVAIGVEGERGQLAPGLAADFVVLSADPSAGEPDWDRLRVLATVKDGDIVFDGGFRRRR